MEGVGRVLRSRRHRKAVVVRMLGPSDYLRQKGAVAKKVHSWGQPQQLSCQEKRQA